MFAVVRTESVPEHLLGYTSRFLQETAPGFFVGVLSPKVWDELWARLQGECGTGRVVAVVSANTESGFRILAAGVTDWTVADIDGIDMPVRLA